jgi:hypothetical protein
MAAFFSLPSIQDFAANRSPCLRAWGLFIDCVMENGRWRLLKDFTEPRRWI